MNVAIPMNTTDVLTLIENPENYIRNYFATGKDGGYTSPEDERACNFCSRGAVLAIIKKKTWMPMSDSEKLLHKAAKELYPEFIDTEYPAAIVNNRFGHAGAMKVFNKAIELSQ